MLALTRTAGSALGRILAKLYEVRPAPAGRPALQDLLEVALWSAVFLVAAFTPPANAEGSPNAPGDAWLREHTGGGLCIYRRLTGIECPGCGLSRGFVQLEHGHLVAAVKLNPLSPVVFLWIAAKLSQALALCLAKRDVRNRIPWWVAWKMYGTVGVLFALLGVYRVAFRFM